MWKKILVGIGIFLVLIVVLVVFYLERINIDKPDVALEQYDNLEIKHINDTLLVCDYGWLRKNKYGFWEMYLEGNAVERGVAFGKLCKDLMAKKEAAFIGEIKKRVPSENYLSFLKYLVAWFNRDLDKYIPEEIKEEIYAGSQYMSDDFDYIGPKYMRALNYHAAHDIGHALQNMNLVGCTAFAAWDDATEDGKLLLGRNFDFYFGDEFAKDKIVAFYNPEEGFKFASITWAGFSGVVSGMNEKGLTVTLNSAKSEIPTKAKTPVSVIGRMILQYASNIDEAFKIAKSYDSFVSESFLIGSKEDGKAALIEKSQDTTVLYTVNDDELIITNHYLSDALKNSSLNKEYMSEEVSQHRYSRVEELMHKKEKLNVLDYSEILRDQCGPDSSYIGLGNERAINQLLAHHSIILSPDDKEFWLAAPPYMLGTYVAYDLDYVFTLKPTQLTTGISDIDSLNIPPDPFLTSADYRDYRKFAAIRDQIQQFLFSGDKRFKITDSQAKEFIATNPESYMPYFYLGQYYNNIQEYDKSVPVLEEGLTKVIARTSEKKKMEEDLQTAKSKLAS